MSSKPLLVRIPEDLHARVKDHATVYGTSMTQVATAALEAYLNSSYVLITFTEEETGDSAGDLVVRIPEEEVAKLWRKNFGPDKLQDS